MTRWNGNELDGYLARVGDVALYVSPIQDEMWSWSVTSISPLGNVANHVETNSPKATSSEAMKAAEGAAEDFLNNL